MVLAVAHPWAPASSYLSSQSVAVLPVARLIMGTPSFIRLVKAEGALRLPSADGDDLDFSAADWDPLSLECPD